MVSHLELDVTTLKTDHQLDTIFVSRWEESDFPRASVGRGEKTPTSKISTLLRKRPVLLRANVVLTKGRKRPYYRHFCGKYTGRGLVVKRPGVL